LKESFFHFKVIFFLLYLIYFAGILKLQLFWTDDSSVPAVPVRDIYKLEFQRFLMTPGWGQFDFPIWSAVYIFSTCVFVAHAWMGWKKLVTSSAFGIPKLHQNRVVSMGVAIFVVLGLIYISFPGYVMYVGQVKCGAAKTGNSSLLNTQSDATQAFSYQLSCNSQ